ncbi:LamG-like jellyroll fold domain-containing protein [Kribbella sp. NPDC055071]
MTIKRSRLLKVASALVAAIALTSMTVQPGGAAGVTTWSGATPPLPTPWTAQVSPTNALPDYPRPQLARPTAAAPTWTNLNGLWQFSSWDGFSPITFGQSLSGKVLVPYPIESVLSGVQKHYDYMLYRRTVVVPTAYTKNNQHVRLNFGAVTYDATVYVNGQQVARHLGGYDAFSADITSALTASGPQEIIVAVHSPVDSAHIPVGKQRLDPGPLGGVWFTASSGIWQTVWLEPVQSTSIAGFTATPDVDTGSFTVTATYNGDVTGARLSVDVFDGAKKVASGNGSATGPLRIVVPKPHLWTPDDPHLYTFKARVKSDVVESYAGLREVAVENVNGKQRVTLNHKPTFLLGTLDQGFWPDGIYTAPTDEALEFDLQKTKDLGFNTIRKHIKIEPARWYYWADKLGLMVWQDIPAMTPESSGSLTAGEKANFRAEAGRMVDQLRNVTSIIGWIPFNEGWGQWSVQAAADVGTQLKTQDPTRLMDERSGTNCCYTPGDPGGGDVIDWHVYPGPALPAPDAQRASMDGEHGGYNYSVAGHLWPGAPTDLPNSVTSNAALTDAYVANTAVLRDQGAPYGLSGSVYTEITDIEGEQPGLLTYDRAYLKVDEQRVRTVNQEVIAAATKAPPTPPAGTPGLTGVHAWAFDEGTGTSAADSVGTDPLTLTGGAQWTSGLTGGAVQFGGNGSAATTGPVLTTDANNNYSVSAWVRFNQVGGGFQTVVGEDGAQNSTFFLQWSAADQRLAFAALGTRAVAKDVVVQPGRWYHLVGVRDITASTLTIYVDGQKAGSTSVLGFGDKATGPLTVGRGRFGGGPVDFLNGSVDGVRVFDRALSAAEVTALFAQNAS